MRPDEALCGTCTQPKPRAMFVGRNPNCRDCRDAGTPAPIVDHGPLAPGAGPLTGDPRHVLPADATIVRCPRCGQDRPLGEYLTWDDRHARVCLECGKKFVARRDGNARAGVRQPARGIDRLDLVGEPTA